MSPASSYRINEPLVATQEIEGEAILIHFDTGCYYCANATGAFVLEQLRQGRALEDIGPAMARRFEVPLEAAAGAAYRFLEELLREGESVEPPDLAANGLPSITGVVDVGGQRVRFVGLHTRWPVLPDLARARDEALRRTRGIRAQLGPAGGRARRPHLSPDAPGFARLLSGGGLSDAMAGQGWQPTWLPAFWPLAPRIDHVLVSPGLCARQAAVGPGIGSDHRPVVARLHLPGGVPGVR